MPWLSENPMWETFGTRALFMASYGGADFGECQQVVAAVGDDGTVDDWHREWTARADGLVEAADASADKGHRVSAREAYTRATTYYRVGYYPLYGAPTDERVVKTTEREADAFARAAPLYDMPVELLEIPYEDGITLPGAFIAPTDDGRPRPTIVHVNGYDSNIGEMFIAHVFAAIARGYNILLFDGPGQGRNLIRDGIHMRGDWEHVVRPVLDLVLERPDVDTDRVVLAGWSFGGFLAPRAAGFEDRIAALWADPGQWDQRVALMGRLPLSDEDKEQFPDIDPAKLAPMEEYLNSPDAPAMLRWSMIQRGMWVHGVPTLFDYLKDFAGFEISPVAGNITCPTLITRAEGDMVGASAPLLYDAIGSEHKALIDFATSEGASGHCEAPGRRLFHQRCYDWLDEALAATT
jgi:pimeloyl-ACP methyl ester carboxylesterase